MVKVCLLGGLVKDAAGGSDSIEVEATNIRQLFKSLGEQHPRLQKMAMTKQLAVSIDGNIFRDNWQEPIPENAEVWILPRIAGG